MQRYAGDITPEQAWELLTENPEAVRSAELPDQSLVQLGRTFFTLRSALPAWGAANLESADLPRGPGGLVRGPFQPATDALLHRCTPEPQSRPGQDGPPVRPDPAGACGAGPAGAAL